MAKDGCSTPSSASAVHVSCVPGTPANNACGNWRGTFASWWNRGVGEEASQAGYVMPAQKRD